MSEGQVMQTEHPQIEQLSAFALGKLDAPALDAVESHLAQCLTCCETLSQSKEAVERFRREVKAAGSLHHPNIVHAYDAEQAGDLHFLVMEFVKGTDLQKVLEQRGPLPLVEACEYIRQAALGLQHAHENG